MSAKTVVVIEIGNDWLKVVEGRASGAVVSLTKTSFKKLAQIKEPISDAILKILKELDIAKPHVISYIPRHLITVRILELPSTDFVEIGEMINLQIGKQTPYSKEEIVFTYRIIDSLKEDYTKVMLVIAKRNIVNERLDALQKAGIETEKVTLSSEGVSHWFNTLYLSRLRLENSQAVILVDIDSNYSDFMLFHKGKLVFTKNVLIGTNHLFDDKDNHYDKFIEELVHSKDVAMEEWRGIKAVKLFLSGATRNMKDITGTLSARLDMPCEMINALKDVRVNSDEAISEGESLKYVSISSILGFLIKHGELLFNLMPTEVRIQKLMEDKRRNLTVLGVLLSAMVMVLSIWVFIKIDNRNTYLSEIKQKINAIKNDSDGVERMSLSINLIRERSDARGDTLNLLNDIYSVLPEKIYLSGIHIERKGRISLRGRSTVMSDVFKFINKIENLPNFKNVQNTYSTTNKENNMEYSTEFEITAVYRDANEH